MTTVETLENWPDADARAQLARLLDLRRQLAEERAVAVTPGVARACELAEIELFLGLTYLGYTDRLFPHEE